MQGRSGWDKAKKGQQCRRKECKCDVRGDEIHEKYTQRIVIDRQTWTCVFVARPSGNQVVGVPVPWLVVLHPAEPLGSASPRQLTCGQLRPHFRPWKVAHVDSGSECSNHLVLAPVP
jgi:hypothetical protein